MAAKKTSKNGKPSQLLAGGGAPAIAELAAHVHDGEKTIVIKPSLWKNKKARQKLKNVVKDLETRAAAPPASATAEEVVYQWCVVDGRGFWCVCETVIIGGQPKLICHEILEP